MTNAEAERLLDEFAEKLGEHFDAVQILASWNEESITAFAKRGRGNWYARIGMAQEFLQTSQAQVAAQEIKEVLPPPPPPEEEEDIPF